MVKLRGTATDEGLAYDEIHLFNVWLHVWELRNSLSVSIPPEQSEKKKGRE
jgi:hypothetical protein